MNILRRMVFREFAGIFLLSMVAITGLFVIIDFFDRVQRYSGEWGAPVSLLLSYMLYKVPQIIYDMVPLALPLSALMALGMLSRNHELVAIRAGGISARSVLAPIFIFALLCAVGMFAVGEYLIPSSNKQLQIVYRQMRQHRHKLHTALEGKGSTLTFNEIGVGWYRGAQGLYYIESYEVDKNIMKNFSLIILGKEFRMDKRLDANRAVWSEDGWVAENVVVRHFLPGGAMTTTTVKSMILPIIEKPSDFIAFKTDPQRMGYFNLKKFIERLESKGSDMQEFRVDLWAKVSYPLAGFILLVLTVPMGLREGRGVTLSLGIVLSIAICLAYYEFHAWMISLGHGGLVQPLTAAWSADILFGIMGIFAFRRSN